MATIKYSCKKTKEEVIFRVKCPHKDNILCSCHLALSIEISLWNALVKQLKKELK